MEWEEGEGTSSEGRSAADDIENFLTEGLLDDDALLHRQP